MDYKQPRDIVVVDQERKPVRNARIRISGPQGDTFLDRGDSRGRYRADAMPPGEYRIEVEAPGLRGDKRSVRLRDEDRFDELFILGIEDSAFFYRGRSRVPFTRFADAVALVIEERHMKGVASKAQLEQLLGDLGSKYSASVEPLDERIARNGVALLRFPERMDDAHLDRYLAEIRDDDRIAHDGAILRADNDGVVMLTSTIIARFEEGIDERSAADIAARYGLKIGKRMNNLGPVWRLHLEGPASYKVLDACNRLAEDEQVVYAEPNTWSTVEEDAVVPTDFLFPEQWDHQIIGTTEAWQTLRDLDEDKTFGSSDIIIAVVDSGVDAAHPEFSGTVTSGQPKVYQLFNFHNMVANNDSRSGNHGTCCASAATARANNPSAVAGVNEGVAGLAGNCRLMGIRRGGAEARYSEMYQWIAGMDVDSEDDDFPAQISPGADVITSSFGSSVGSPISGLMADTFDAITDNGRGGKGCLLFFSAGNGTSGAPNGVDDDLNNQRPWGMYNRCFSVTASSLANDGVTETRAPYSNWSSQAEFCAPSNRGRAHNPPASYRTFTATELNSSWVATAPGRHHLTVGRPTVQSTLNAAASAGTTTLTVSSTTGFANGQAILVGAPGAAGTEGHLINAVNAASNQITINRPLFNAHANGDAVAASQGDYRSNFGGTSHATPLCAGLAALMLSANPDLTWQEVRDIIRTTAGKIDPNNTNAAGRWRDEAGRISSHPDYTAPFFSEYYGYGRIDADAAVKRAGWLIEQVTLSLNFTDVPEDMTVVRAARFDVRTLWDSEFEIIAGPGPDFETPYGTSVSLPADGDFETEKEVYLWVAFTGGTPNTQASGSITVRHTQTGQEWVIPISANSKAKETTCVMMCLDKSWSMTAFSGIEGQKRIDVLRYSARILVDVAQEGDGIGIVGFDQDPHDVIDPPAGPLDDPGNPFDPARNSLRAAINTFSPSPSGLTAIGDGIERAQTRLDSVSDYENKAIVVFTDGKETASKYISDVSHLIHDRVFAIGLGKGENIEPDALTAICNGHNGYVLLTGDLGGDDDFKLAKYFLQILVGINNEDVIVDPQGRVQREQTLRIPFQLCRGDIRSDVICMMPYKDVIRLRLQTPDGDIIEPSMANGFPGSLYHSGANVGYYRLSLPAPIGGGAHAGRWHALLDIENHGLKQYLANLSKIPTEYYRVLAHGVQYSLLVHAYSNLRMRVRLQQPDHRPGGKFYLQIAMNEFGRPLRSGVHVWVTVTDPAGERIRMRPDRIGSGGFELAVPTRDEGTYTCLIRAKGRSHDGCMFSREQVRTAAVWTDHGKGDRPGGKISDQSLKRIAELLGQELDKVSRRGAADDDRKREPSARERLDDVTARLKSIRDDLDAIDL